MPVERLPGNIQFAAQVDPFVSFCPMAAMARRTFAAVTLKGAPPFRPRARPDASPAFVRSEIRSRSNSASAAKIPNTSMPSRRGGVDTRTVADQHLKADAARAEA